MTGCTVVDYPRMIKYGCSKATGDVTGAAIGGRRNMPQTLAGCSGAIVTRGATIDNPGMIIDGTDKIGGVVANAAVIGCWYVCR